MFSRLNKINLLRPSIRCYHKNVLDHYENPRNVGDFDKNDKMLGLDWLVHQLVDIKRTRIPR